MKKKPHTTVRNWPPIPYSSSPLASHCTNWQYWLLT